MVMEMRTAPMATGERFPYIRSEMYPRAMLPNIAPRSITVERLATSPSLYERLYFKNVGSHNSKIYTAIFVQKNADEYSITRGSIKALKKDIFCSNSESGIDSLLNYYDNRTFSTTCFGSTVTLFLITLS